MPPRARHRQGTHSSGESILRYGLRLRYHLAPDLQLTSRGASLAAKRHSNSPSAPSSEQPRWVDFPCINRRRFHILQGSSKVRPLRQITRRACLSSSRLRGLGGLATRLSLRVRLHLRGATVTLQAYKEHDLLYLTTTSCTNVEIPERASGLASLRPARG